MTAPVTHLPIVPTAMSSAPAVSTWPRDRWFAVLEARRLGARPLAVRRFATDLVLWRDATGAPVLMPAYCPHRGAALADGRVVGGEIECPYHGFRFDGRGACTAIPCEGPDARIPAGLDVTPVPCREAHGMIWMWFGDTEPMCEVPPPPVADLDSRRMASTQYIWDGSYERVIEGLLDLHHVAFLHRRTALGLVGPRVEIDDVVVAGETIRFGGVVRGGRGLGATQRFDFVVGYPATIYAEVQPKARVLVEITPIDDTRTWVNIRYHHDRIGPWPVSRAIAWVIMAYERRFVLPEDAGAVARTRPVHSTMGTNKLVRADEPIAAWHRLHAHATRTR